MEELWRGFWGADMLSPHGYCLLWRPELLWGHVVADALIGSAYLSIPFALAIFVRRRKDVAFGWMFWCFVLFITACGLTHYMSIVTLWQPWYAFEALLKLATAGVSVATAVLLWPLLPRALKIPSVDEMRAVNESLVRRISERDQAIVALERETAERLRVEEALLQARKMEALGQLTGGIAHDFNNLLTVIRGASEMLQRGDVPEARRQLYLRGIEDAAVRASKLTAQLMTFASRQTLNPELINVNGHLRALRDLLVHTVGDPVHLEMALDPSLKWARVDATQFEMAVINIAKNSRDAMSGGGQLTIATENVTVEEKAWVRVRISDTGPGMTKEVAQRAFEPFFSTKGPGKGTGLGLSQVYGFVTQSGGSVSLESAPGAGVTICLDLPSADEAGGDQERTEGIQFAPGGSALIVEDNPTVAAFLAELLSDLGFRPATAESGEAGLEAVERSRPRVVVSDIVMPGMTGVEFARLLSERHPNMPIVLASGYSEESPSPDTPWPLLHKPFTRAALIAALNEVLAAAPTPGA